MKIISLSILSILLLAGCVSQQQKQAIETSQKQAELWLHYLDEGMGEDLWQVTADVVHDTVYEDAFLKYHLGIRKPLGKVIKRKLQYNWVLDSYRLRLPDGQYRIVCYWTDYEFKKGTQENLILSLQNDGQWKVVQWGIDNTKVTVWAR